MSQHILLLSQPLGPADDFGDQPVVPVRQYLTGPWHDQPGLRVVNLCRDISYHSAGYYASLLAEARGHRVIPSVRTLQDLSRRAIYAADLDDLEDDLDQALAARADSEDAASGGAREVSFYLLFGEVAEAEFSALRGLGRSLFESFPVPILRVELRRREKKGWEFHALRPSGLRGIPTEMRPTFFKALERFLGRARIPEPNRPARWDLAILHDPDEAFPPSNPEALAAFIAAARRAGIDAELITRRDLSRLSEYDALFIRETTAVSHHTWRFARKAAAEGLVVIDDPDSILRCTNKIFLSELLTREKVPIPASVVIGKDDLDRAEEALGFPMVLKVPDGAFSLGVFKVKDRPGFDAKAKELFAKSELLLAQAYTPTEFDWRVGVLGGEPLYVCRYHMSRGHWQIMNHAESGEDAEGAVDTIPVAEAPAKVVETAVRAASLIGDGLYGVDLKQSGDDVFVIEVNDNPNIDAGYEDAVLGEALYDQVIAEFLRRLEAH